MRQMDPAGLAEFLRRRREALQPEDVGLPRTARRRTSGLRREEVAALSSMSADYYARIERGSSPQPSEQMLAAIAHGLHLTVDERDHLFLLAGHQPAARGGSGDHVGPGLQRILDRLVDTPAEVVTELGETLMQTPMGVALTGDTAHITGPERSMGYRWFADPASRRLFAAEDHAALGRLWVSGLREVATKRGPGSRAARYVELLLPRSAEFRELWGAHEVGLRPGAVKRFEHPELGRLELSCQTLTDPEQAHHLLVYTAAPGSESHEKLRLLGVIGAQRMG
ncbi:helix-turn-helix domain-containing protein [Clavibacter capsici]|uniref:Helix-turn-helix domain-containing protein n=1 Tax=Clavibacter capsici TaxID=1874630 RepID=A0A0M3RRD8_9MICO|nr:helix-turn-helix transcriptional regulator [Clavibacter capsici]ALD13449.1 XRE family transcriptional regulator [Clavibacter capsici]QIS42704.1 helix-turn-helix domain-containing protein [Clavibacter capsici]QIS45650.1 helix-turn-helix domain-containing protein [Clavibacter capsici]